MGLRAEERSVLSPGDNLHEPGLEAEERNKLWAPPSEDLNGSERGDLNAMGGGLLEDLYEPGGLKEADEGV